MITVHKYVIDQPVTEVKTHAGARFLHAANQYGQVTVWAQVDTDAAKVTAPIALVVTGGPVPADSTHVGTVLDGIWVLHVYASPGRPAMVAADIGMAP